MTLETDRDALIREGDEEAVRQQEQNRGKKQPFGLGDVINEAARVSIAKKELTIEVKPEDEGHSLCQYKIVRDNTRIGWIVKKEDLGFLGLNKNVSLSKQEKWQLAEQLSNLFHVIYEVTYDSELYELMRKIWSGDKFQP
jgi:hypothetical protein